MMEAEALDAVRHGSGAWLRRADGGAGAEITAGGFRGPRAGARLRFDLPERWFEIDGSRRGGGDHALDGRAFFTGVPRAGGRAGGHRDAPRVADRAADDAARRASATIPGQVAFPGGKIDASDASPLAAALREAEEEVGLDRAAVTPLGYLDPYLTGTGFMVMPALCLIRPPLRLRINPAEVADAFEVPLPYLMDPSNHRKEARQIMGRDRHFYSMTHQDRVVWAPRRACCATFTRSCTVDGPRAARRPRALPAALRRLCPLSRAATSLPLRGFRLVAGPLAALVVAGLALAVLSLLAAGFFGHRGQGDYVPAHLENGVLVPGRMR